MMKIPRLAVLLMFVVFSSPGIAEICKWVDENGVVHYAETCPEDIDSTEIEIQAPPSQAQVEEAVRRLEQMQEKISKRKEAELQEEAANSLATEESVEENDARERDTCLAAKSNLRILSEQRPVYFDDEGNIQFDRSVYSLAYKGERRFIEDQKRSELVQNWKNAVDYYCDVTKTEPTAQE